MSYSFNIQAATKAAAKQAISQKLAQVEANQPVHRADRQQAEATAHAFVDQLQDDDARDIAVSVNGSLGWSGSLDAQGLTGEIVSTSVGVSARLVPRSA